MNSALPRFNRHASIAPKQGGTTIPKMLTAKNPIKAKALEWSHQAHRSVKSVAEALDIHPFILSGWPKGYREVKFAMKRVKKALTNAKKKIQDQDEIARLKRLISELQEENAILKKFQSFQAEERRKRSDSSGDTDENAA
jgi:transposase